MEEKKNEVSLDELEQVPGGAMKTTIQQTKIIGSKKPLVDPETLVKEQTKKKSRLVSHI